MAKLYKEGKITIYSKKTCPYCKKAKTLLKDNNLDYIEIVLDSLTDDEYVLLTERLKKETKQRTVPNIFIGSKHVGGFDDLKDLCDFEELNELLDKEGIYYVNFSDATSSYEDF